MKPSKRTFTSRSARWPSSPPLVWLLTTRGPLAPVGVEIASVTRGDLNPAVYGIGTWKRDTPTPWGHQAGRVLRVSVDQGDRVRSGQLLAEIDPVDLRQRAEAAASTVARARQTAQAAQAQVAEANSRARLAQANRARYQALVRQGLSPRKWLTAAVTKPPPPKRRWPQHAPMRPARNATSAVQKPNYVASTSCATPSAY